MAAVDEGGVSPTNTIVESSTRRVTARQYEVKVVRWCVDVFVRG